MQHYGIKQKKVKFKKPLRVKEFKGLRLKVKFCISFQRWKCLFEAPLSEQQIITIRFNFCFFPSQLQVSRISKCRHRVRTNTTARRPVRRFVNIFAACWEAWHVPCTSFEMSRLFLGSLVQRNGGGSRRRRWPSRPKESSWRGCTGLRYQYPLLTLILFNSIATQQLNALLSLAPMRQFLTNCLFKMI